MKTKKSGFTLLELLVVMSLFGMLASIVLGSVRSARVKALDANVRITVNELRTAANSYYNDYNEYPPIPTNPSGGGWDVAGVQLLNQLHSKKYISLIPKNVEILVYRTVCGPNTPCGGTQMAIDAVQTDIMNNWLIPTCGNNPVPKAALYFRFNEGLNSNYPQLPGVANATCFY